MTARVWRLLEDGANNGAWNMAVDSALLRSRASGGAPTLRLYRWRVPTASLGRFQAPADVDAGACRELGVDVVRRPTGGRGVLHDDELTYSVVAAEDDGVPRGVAASYRHLSTGLVEAYRLLGVPASLTAGAGGERGSAACYLAATQADLSLGGAKLSGSAQVWKHGACLQHGSFVLTRDVAREARVFGLDGTGAAALAGHAVTIEEATGRRPGLAEVAAAVAGGVRSRLGVRLEPAGLTAAEFSLATELAETFSLLRIGDGA